MSFLSKLLDWLTKTAAKASEFAESPVGKAGIGLAGAGLKMAWNAFNGPKEEHEAIVARLEASKAALQQAADEAHETKDRVYAETLDLLERLANGKG